MSEKKSFQQKAKAVRDAFDTLVYNFGVASADTSIDFEFNYKNEELPLQALKAQCGCTNLRIEDGKIKGALKLSNAAAYAGVNSIYVTDKEDRLWRVKGEWAESEDPRYSPVPLKELEGVKPLPLETKHFTVYFDDGEDFNVIDDKGVLTDNPEKAKTTLSIRGFVKI